VEALAFSRDGTRLYSADKDSIKVWEMSPGDRRQCPVLLSDSLFSPDCTRLVNVSGKGKRNENRRGSEVEVFDLAGEKVLALDVPKGPSHGRLDLVDESFAWSKDGKQIAGAMFVSGQSPVLKVLIWNAFTGKVVRTLDRQLPDWDRGAVLAAFRPDGSCLVAGSFRRPDTEKGKRKPGGLLKVWDVAAGRELLTVQSDSGGAANLGFSPNGRLLATAGGPGDQAANGVTLWDVTAGNEIRAFQGGTDFEDLTFSPDGTRLVAHSMDASETSQALVWDIGTGGTVSVLKGHAGAGQGFVFSPDGRRIASVKSTARGGSEVHLWDTATGDELLTLQLPATAVGLAFSPDGHRVIAVGQAVDRRERWEITRSSFIYTPTGQHKKYDSSGFIQGGVIQIWDATPRQESPKANP
jgi:WD40 repeat protein